MNSLRTYLIVVTVALVTPLIHAQQEDEAVYDLSPFTISEEETVGYQATTTLAGSRLKTNLRDVGAAVSVLTK